MERVKETTYVIGIDEVGRGPIAGPVVVCACAVEIGLSLLHLFPDEQLKDSKKLTEKKRISIVEKLQPYVETSQVVVGIGEVSAEDIDQEGISTAITNATEQALKKLEKQGISKSSFVFLDGSLKADASYTQETVIKGDEKIIEIALASIVAKVYRDTYMKKIADAYPDYGFEKHMGYGTAFHYEAITIHGMTSLHRTSFLKRVLNKS